MCIYNISSIPFETEENKIKLQKEIKPTHSKEEIKQTMLAFKCSKIVAIKKLDNCAEEGFKDKFGVIRNTPPLIIDMDGNGRW